MSLFLFNKKIYIPFLLCIASLLYFSGIFFFPPLDRTEAKFAQSSKQMVESKNFRTPYFQHQVRAKKPLGIYHIQSFSALLFGQENIVSYRIPSLFFSLLSALLVTLVFSKLLPPKLSFLASLFYICSIGVVAEAKIARVDASLLFFCNLQQLCLYGLICRTTLFSKSFSLLGFWVGLIGGIMLKGFITPVLAMTTFLTFFTWERKWRNIKRCHFEFGLPVLALIIVPYFHYTTSQTPDFFSQCIQSDFIPKIISIKPRHTGLPGLTTLFLAGSFFPGSLFFPLGLFKSLSLFSKPTVRFMLSWALPFLVVLEFIPQKLTSYSLPIFLPLAYIAVLTFKTSLLKKTSLRVIKIDFFYKHFILFLFFISSAIAWFLYLYFQGSLFAAICITTINFILFREGLKISSELINSHLYRFITCYILTVLLITGWMLPSVKNFFASQDIHDALFQYGRKKTALVGYEEPSAIFLLGTDTILGNANNISQAIEKETSFYLVVPKNDEKQILEELKKRDLHGKYLKDLDTFNITKGKKLSLALYTFEN